MVGIESEATDLEDSESERREHTVPTTTSSVFS